MDRDLTHAPPLRVAHLLRTGDSPFFSGEEIKVAPFRPGPIFAAIVALTLRLVIISNLRPNLTISISYYHLRLKAHLSAIGDNMRDSCFDTAPNREFISDRARHARTIANGMQEE